MILSPSTALPGAAALPAISADCARHAQNAVSNRANLLAKSRLADEAHTEPI